MIKDNHKKDILRLLKDGTWRPSLYEVLTSSNNIYSRYYNDTFFDFKCLAWVNCFNNTMVNLNVIAMEEKKSSMDGTFLWRKYDDITRLKLIEVAELPLYLNWGWLSDDFFRILKGDIIMPCSRYVHKVRI